MERKIPILLVDDQPANLLALESVLDAPGYELVTARTGAEAIEKVARGQFAAVILDVQMPGLDGYDTARRIKSLPNGRDIPLIFVTAIYTESEDMKRGYKVGALDYIAKPFDPDVLRAKVGIYADLYARRNALTGHARPGEAAGALRRFRDEIVARWKVLVLGDPRVPEANRLPEPELRDHVPLLIDHVAAALDAPDQEVALIADQKVKLHARQRFDANYDIAETLRELSHLRVAIHSVLAEHGVEPDLSGVLAIGRCLDEVMATDAVEVAKVSAEALEHEAQTRERFIAVLAHDLRQPINSIELGAYLLLDSGLDGQTADIATRIARSAERMADMVRELLDYARTSRGEAMPITLQEGVDLLELIEHVVEEARGAHPAAVIRVEGAPSVRGRSDPGRLTQAIANLVSNAITHGAPARPITVTLGTDGARAWISVHNENRGGPIEPERLADIFSPFRRPLRPTTHGGLGLGLYIASAVVRAHGGALVVDSDDSGTTFTISLPKSAAKDARVSET